MEMVFMPATSVMTPTTASVQAIELPVDGILQDCDDTYWWTGLNDKASRTLIGIIFLPNFSGVSTTQQRTQTAVCFIFS